MASKSVTVPSIVGAGKPARYGVSIDATPRPTFTPAQDRDRFVCYDGEPREVGYAGRVVDGWPFGRRSSRTREFAP